MQQSPSRLDKARSQVRIARYSLGAAAVVGFAFFALVARAAHPGKSSASNPTTPPTSQDQLGESFDFGGGSISPSTGAPTVQSGGS